MISRATRVVVVLRQSPDWHALASGEHHDTAAFDRFIGRPVGTTAELIAFWNATFPVGFYEARASMKDVTLDNLHRMAGVAVLPLEQFRPPYDGQALYAFTDDDDWFAPDLADALLGSSAGVSDAAVWTSVRFDGGFLTRPNDGFCYTNTYCVHGGFLAGGDAERGAAAVQHMSAQVLLHEPGVFLARLDRPLSVTHKHPCSTLTLERARREGGLLDLLGAYRRYQAKSSGERRAEAGSVAWALPYTDRVSALFASLPRSPTEALSSA